MFTTRSFIEKRFVLMPGRRARTYHIATRRVPRWQVWARTCAGVAHDARPRIWRGNGRRGSTRRRIKRAPVTGVILVTLRYGQNVAGNGAGDTDVTPRGVTIGSVMDERSAGHYGSTGNSIQIIGVLCRCDRVLCKCGRVLCQCEWVHTLQRSLGMTQSLSNSRRVRQVW